MCYKIFKKNTVTSLTNLCCVVYFKDITVKGENMLVIDDVLDAKEVAKILKVTPRTVVRLAERGELKAFRVGDLWRFRRADIEEYIEKQIRRQSDQ